MIGLMLTKDDPCKTEVIRQIIPYLDSLYILNGDDKKDEEFYAFLAGIKIPCFHHTESKLGISPPISNPVREHLLQEIQLREKEGDWVYLTHGDEIPLDNPIIVARQAEILFADAIEWGIVNFFIHDSQYKAKLRNRIVEEGLTIDDFHWYFLPAWRKVRMFRLDKGYHYDFAFPQHEFPIAGMQGEPKIVKSNALIRHYPFIGNMKLMKKKTIESLERKRLLSVAFSWIGATDIKEPESIFLVSIPEVPGIINKVNMEDSHTTPLPITYR